MGLYADTDQGSSLLGHGVATKDLPQANVSKEVSVTTPVNQGDKSNELLDIRDSYRKDSSRFQDSNEASPVVYVSGSKQPRGSVDLSEANVACADRQEYPRRTERGRRGRGVSSAYYPTSRTFSNEDPMAYGTYYAEAKSYSRSSRGITFTRGHRALGNSTSTMDSRGRRPLEEQRSREFRAVQAYGGGSGYSSGRNARVATSYYDFEDREQGNSLDFNPRSSTNTQDTRRQQPYRGRQPAGASHFSTEFRPGDHFSDGEQSGGSRKHTRVHRNRSHEGPRQTYKSSTQRLTEGRDHQICETIDNAALGDHTDATAVDVPLLDDYGDSDIPTVRVPAADMGLGNRLQYAHPRAGRSGTFPRGGPRRNPNRITSMQNKRTPGSGVSSSRRYRDQRDRYRDDKDEDGGAAAGGTGHSATGGETSAANGSGAGSRSTGCGNVSGNQGSGGPREASFGGGVLAADSNLIEMGKGSIDGEEKSIYVSSTDSTNHNYADGIGADRDTQEHRSGHRTAGGADPYGSYARGYQTGSHSRRTHLSVSGGRSNTGQRFHRSITNRYFQSDHSTRHTNMSSIPPLMSIKPHAPFRRSPKTLEQLPTTDPKPNHSQDSNIDLVHKGESDEHSNGSDKILLTTSEPQEDDSDRDSILSDGFTKVVTKASKRFARRRLKQELSASAKSSVRRTIDPSKAASLVDCKREHSNQSTPGNRHVPTVTNKLALRKTKPFPVKPTFMGPPLSSVNTTPPSEALVSKTNALASSDSTAIQHIPKAWVSTASVQSTVATCENSQPVVSTTRPWSKVVGTKSSSASTATEKNESRIPNSTVSMQGVEAAWSIEVAPAETVVHSKMDSVATNLPQIKETPVILNARDQSLANTFVSAHQFWSESDEKGGKGDSKVSVAIPAAGTNALASVSPSVISSGTPVNTSVSVSVSTVSNNICKVRPQQQQQQQISPEILTVSASSVTVAPISPNNHPTEQLPTVPAGASEVPVDIERSECDYDSNMVQARSARRLPPEGALLVAPHPPNRQSSSSWTEGAPPQLHANYYSNRPGALPLATGMDNSFSANVWPATDHVVDGYGNRLAPIGGSAVNQPYSQMHGSDVLSHLFTGPNTSLCPDPSTKSQQPIALMPRSHSYSVQPYGPSVVSSGDLQGVTGLYGGETNKLSSHTVPQSQTAAFAAVTGSVFVQPHQQSTGQQAQPTHSFPATWTVTPNTQRYRQRFAHQVEPSTFGGYAYQGELQNEYTYLPSGTGCVQPAAPGGLFSAVQGQPQSTYHPHNSARHNVGHPTASNPWSLLGNPTGASNLQASTQDYSTTLAPAATGGIATGGGGGGLLPHPIPPGGYNAATHGSVSLPVSTSPNSNFVAHHSYVGVPGGGRQNPTEFPNVSSRQRGVTQNIFPSHNISHSPSAQSQPQFPVHSAFYPSLSPSHHQRLQQLQQLTGSQGRPNVPGLMNPATGLYAAAFGAAPQPNQPTPPPLPPQLGYAAFTSESNAATPLSFYSTSQSQSTVGLQHAIHGQRSGQSTAPHMASRTVGPVASHGGSPLLIPNVVGPSALSGYGQPTHSAALSGYPIKHVLPTL